MRKDHKTATIFIFLGFLLVVVFAVGILTSRNPETFRNRYLVDETLEAFLRFCVEWWIPAGIIGIPMLLVSLVLSLWRETKDAKKMK